MTRPTVVVLSSHTLFAEGVTSRLKLREEALNLSVIDAHSADAMDQILTVGPDAVIVDASDKEVGLNCPINELLAAIPALKIIRLDPEQAGFQVVTSTQHIAKEVDDLLEVITDG
jgi:DNA-binding NarL/FixJ family response regulator